INAEYGRALELQERLKEDTAVFIEQICSFDFPRYKGATKVDKETSDTIKDLRNEAKSIIQGLQKNCSDNLEQSIHQLRAMKQPMTDLIALTKAFEQRFKAKKEAKNLLDFNDLEQVTLRILKEPKVAEEVQEQYSHVFLDEYQDTNEMQEAIISQIVRSDNYFMVGDVKQSIYRFRLADPSIFIGKYNRFKSEESGCDQLVTLSQNFRSCQGVIDSVNAVFERIMRPELGEITYDDDARLYKGLSAKGDYAKTAIHIIEDTSGDEDAEISEMSAVEIEARFIGREIQNRVGKAVFDTKSGTMQTLKYRDIGVLMRSVANRGEVFAKIFSELGIPAYFDGGDHYYESLEMGIILNLLTIIDNKAQDLPLLSVMTSPIGGFSISECTEIRLFNKEGAYYHCVQKYMEEREDALTFKLRAFYKNLDAFRDASKIMDIEDFLWKVYLDTGYYNFVGALPGGEQRQNNLRMLLKRAGDYKRSTLKGLFYFIQFVERMKKHRYDLSPPSILSEQENVVRIMTIHKSKGLEFPVVFLSGVGKRFNKRSNSGRILFHKELGICPEYVNLELRARTSTLARNICIAKNETEMLSEEMRLLYVAMTRAREQLVVVGTIKNKEKKWSQWTKPLQLYQLKKASGLLDWIMLSLVSETEQGRMEEESLNNLEYPSFNIHFYKAEESLKKHQNDWPENEALEIKTLVNKQIEKKVNERLGFVYKTAELDELPGKMTVTEINDLEVSGLKTAEIPERIIKPAFLMTEAEDYSAAERGTALHFMMQNLQLEKLRPVQGNWDNLLEVLEEERRRMIGHELIQAPLAKTIEIKHIGNFIESPLGRRLLSAPIVKREIPFNYCVSPGTIRTEWQEIKTPLVVQGMMDCFFMEGAQWVLLDYKTDRFYNMDGKKTLIERYKAQIEFYAKA
ncbi:MAG: helicase-exonuclease AddAB subunit AddA, partial [Eubacterium sp.]